MTANEKKDSFPPLVRIYQPVENNYPPIDGYNPNKETTSLFANYSLKSVAQFVKEWKEDFIQRMRVQSKSKKRNFNFRDAADCTALIDRPFDKCLVEYVQFIDSDPLKGNDYFKFVNSYFNGKELNIKYFRHDVEKLKKYYSKVDKEQERAGKEERKPINIFNNRRWEAYVLFMMLKIKGLYSNQFDSLFNVKETKSREYNPLTNLPSVLRHVLPFEIKEYDIKQANPTFIFIELGINSFDVYQHIDKTKFNMLLNIHKDVKGYTIDKVRKELFPIYGERVNDVITSERYNNKGKMQSDLAAIEKEYIEKFVEANSLENFVRLHDSVAIAANINCENLKFGDVEFREKTWTIPEVINDTINFYNDDLTTEPALYRKFFAQEGFIRLTMEDKDEITIIKNENKIVTPFNHTTDIMNYLRGEINEFETEEVENIIANDAYKIRSGFMLMDGEPYNLCKDTKDFVFIPFKNGVVRITVDGMELISYEEIDGFFAKHNTQRFNIEFIDVDKNPSEFYVFLSMAITGKDILNGEIPTDKEQDDILAFCSMIGYLLTNYKNPSFNPAIILSDANADGENRNGGRGKSLLLEALKHFRNYIIKGGNSYDPNYTHVHADLKLEHDLYMLDDVPHNFDYNALYTHITGPIDAQRKGTTAETIQFEDAPKFVITTNWAVRYDENATSTNRRFKEFKFSDFWNLHNTPDKMFGHSFFTDWSHDEWQRFYNFGFSCIRIYLNYGLRTIEYDKRLDNFRAYFYNDSLLEEIQRIFNVFESTGVFAFTVTDFIEIHRDKEMYRHRPEFNIRNARKYIDAFIQFQDLPFSYSKRERKWKAIRNNRNAVTDVLRIKSDVTF